nr:hypothetical protein [Methylorubrum rhodinum]
MGRDADQRLVMAFAEGDAPALRPDQPGIGGIAEDIARALVRDLALAAFGEEGMRLQKAVNVGGVAEGRIREPLQRFDDDRRDRLVPQQHLPGMARSFAVAVAHRRAEHGIAVFQARAHADVRLLHVVFALIVGDGDAHVLDKARGGVVAIDHVRRLQRPAHLVDHAPQIAVEVHIPAETVDMVEDDPVALRPVGPHDFEQRIEAGPAARAARQIVREGAADLIATALRVV